MDSVLATVRDLFGIEPDVGIQIVTTDQLARRPIDPAMAVVIVPPAEPSDAEAAPGMLPGRHGHGPDAVGLLQRLYPADHPVRDLDQSGAGTVADLTGERLRTGPVLVPPLQDLDNVASPWGLPWLVARLRAPDGCPWDREQDHRSLRPFLLEETYEVYDALEAGSTPELAGELGDLLLQIVLHAQYASEAGVFDLADVQRAITTKIIRRHPHVFGDVEAQTSAQVIRNWEQIKADERSADGSTADRDPLMPAAFAGLSRSLPALVYANEMQGRAAVLGYDWPDLEGVIDKIAEEASELLAATDARERDEEFGDLLFVIVNLGRKLGIDPEASLRAASRKFASRFARVERLAESRGLELRAMGFDGLDELWQEAKLEESEAAMEGTSVTESRR
jgi:tetrapyrrole methylase family protein/MazG family protein